MFDTKTHSQYIYFAYALHNPAEWANNLKNKTMKRATTATFTHIYKKKKKITQNESKVAEIVSCFSKLILVPLCGPFFHERMFSHRNHRLTIQMTTLYSALCVFNFVVVESSILASTRQLCVVIFHSICLSVGGIFFVVISGWSYCILSSWNLASKVKSQPLLHAHTKKTIFK